MGFKHNRPISDSDVDELSNPCQYNDNDSGSEVALDLRGRKHLEQSDNTDGVYWLLENTPSSYVVFPVPGRASADALRQFLSNRLPPKLITDEYGCVQAVGEISEDHLPTLQAQLWLNNLQDDTRKPSQSATLDHRVQACSPFVQHASTTTPSSAADALTAQEALLVACHATFVAELLQSNHIFVLHSKPRSACEFPTCQTKYEDQPLLPTVTIEPLVHWATITPVTDIVLCRGRIQAFRRNGEKCDDPLWTLALKHFTSQHPISYCSNCLKMLMDNRAEAWAAAAQKKCTSFTPINRPTPGLHAKDFNIGNGFEGSDKKRFTSQRSTHVPEAAMCEDGRPAPFKSSIDQALAASFSLDGACDTRPSSSSSERSTNSPLDSDDTIEQNDCEGHDSSATKDSPFGLSPFTPPSTLPPGSATSYRHTATSAWTAANQTPSLHSSPLVYHFCADSDTQPTSTPEQESSSSNSVRILGNDKKAIQLAVSSNSFTPLQSTKRKFGRELDTNAVLKSPNKAVKMLHKNPKDAADIRNFLSSALQPLPRPMSLVLLETRSLSKIPIPRDPSPEVRSETSWSTTSAEDFQEAPNKHPLPLVPPTTQLRYTAPLPKKKKAPVQAKTKPTKPAPPTKANTQPPFTPFFAKRTPLPFPNTISSPTFQAHLTRHASAQEIICSCRKVALTPAVMIAQCTNHDCAIGWYHYDCLDKSEKISCRHGRLVCQHCRNETFFRDLAVRNGWSVEKMVEGEVKMMFTGREMLAAMPGLGGGLGVVKPYGLGAVCEMEEDEEVRQPARGALGELEFLGYVKSRPGRVQEAYTTARAWVGESGYGRYGEEEDEYYGYEGEYEYEYDGVEDGEEGEEDVENADEMDVN